MVFASKRPPINAAVEACLTPEFRLRIWDVIDHPYRIALGERASLNFEIMLKAAFRRVTTTFDADCGSSTSLPWLTARIDQADRELDGMFYEDQVTVITMTFKAFSPDGREIWATTTVGDTNEKLGFFTYPQTAAARDMGEALRKALDGGYQAMLESDVLRKAIEDGPTQAPAAADPR